ncbi:site-specific integrase [uncultured Actinomyces sp.]|uniref:site-specific integrase n=1 Tax=uncultured Actinomyces sp. TaxID=249061 RepID=UPI002806264E|nr:site-specific integrase [uncultured Actinomyces sp.]
MNQDRPETRGELLDAWTRHLSLRRGLSEHTVRAYAGDLEDLLGFLGVDPDESAPVGPVLRGLTLADLRAWLAALAASGHARATLARRSAAIRSFSTWAHRCGLLSSDVAIPSVLPVRGFLPLRFTRKDVYAHQVVPDVLKAVECWGVSKSATKAAVSLG